MSIIKVLDRPIAFHRCLVKPCGSINGALMLSQAIYWTNTLPPDREGWFWKTMEEWQEETGLTRKEQENARKNLKERGLLEERLAGLPAKLYFRVSESNLSACLLGEIKVAPNGHTSTEVTGIQDGTNPTNYSTEITSESTSKSTSLSPTPLSSRNGHIPSEEIRDRYLKLRPLVYKLFKRHESILIANDEERGLLELCRRPDILHQFAHIAKAWPKFPLPPKSVRSLIERWNEIMDWASNLKPERQ